MTAKAENPYQLAQPPPMRVVLFLLPGFGLHDEDYSRLIASSGVDSHVTFDVWPRTVEEVERTSIGQWDSPKANAWKAAKTRECAERLQELTDAEDTRVIVFAHSAGAEFARRLRLPCVCFGCKPIETSLVRIRGSYDAIAKPCEADTIIDCGHFGCVSKEAYHRACEFQKALGLRPLLEQHKDQSAKIGSIVARVAHLPRSAVKAGQLAGV